MFCREIRSRRVVFKFPGASTTSLLLQEEKCALMVTGLHIMVSYFDLTRYFSEDCGPSGILCAVISIVVVELLVASWASTGLCSLEKILALPCKHFSGVGTFSRRNCEKQSKDSFRLDHCCRLCGSL